MNNHNQTDAELADWIERYLIFRGTWSFTALVNAGGGGSSQILPAVASQDLIRWMEFLNRKVPKEIGRIQEIHCLLSPCRIRGTDWMKLLVTHLIQHSHSQWILRKFTLQDRQHGYLCLQQCRDLLREVDSLLDTPPEEVAVGSQYLLKLVVGRLYSKQYKSIFGVPDKVRRNMYEEARPSRLDFQRDEVVLDIKSHHVIALTEDCWSRYRTENSYVEGSIRHTVLDIKILWT
jgi:hypothetical protein